MDIGKKYRRLMLQVMDAQNCRQWGKLKPLLAQDPTDSERLFLSKSKFLSVSKEIIEELGYALSFEYIDCLTKEDGYQLLWKVQFSNVDQDVLWQIYIDDLTDEPKITGLWFS